MLLYFKVLSFFYTIPDQVEVFHPFLQTHCIHERFTINIKLSRIAGCTAAGSPEDKNAQIKREKQTALAALWQVFGFIPRNDHPIQTGRSRRAMKERKNNHAVHKLY